VEVGASRSVSLNRLDDSFRSMVSLSWLVKGPSRRGSCLITHPERSFPIIVLAAWRWIAVTNIDTTGCFILTLIAVRFLVLKILNRLSGIQRGFFSHFPPLATVSRIWV